MQALETNTHIDHNAYRCPCLDFAYKASEFVSLNFLTKKSNNLPIDCQFSQWPFVLY